MDAQDLGLNWITDLVEEIQEETDLCERCDWVPPSISYVALNGQEYVFLRYSCSTQHSYARMYDLKGNIIGECLTEQGETGCGFGGNAFTIYTFADEIDPIWSCFTGFECEYALEYGVENKVIIRVDESQCQQGIKTLIAPDEFDTYEWYGPEVNSNEMQIDVSASGTYGVNIMDENGCLLNGELLIDDIQKLIVNIKGPSVVCPGVDAELVGTISESYQWSNGTSDSITTVSSSGIYHLTVTNAEGCEGDASFELEYYDVPMVNIIPQSEEVNEGERISAWADYNEMEHMIISFDWSGMGLNISCDTCSEIMYMPRNDQPLELIVVDDNGCESEASLNLIVNALPQEIYAPNIIRRSSNGNDKFTIFGGQNVEVIESLSIFDRWGNKVFSQENFSPNDPNNGWDGRYDGHLLNQQVFTYSVMVRFISGDRMPFGGDVLVIN